MAIKKFNSVAGFSVGNGTPVEVIDETGNVVANNLTVSTTADLGNVGNIIISGGSANYVLTTDGMGNLDWKPDASGGVANAISTDIANFQVTGGSNGQIMRTDGNGNITFQNFAACVKSNVTSIVAGSALDITVDFSNVTYPAGVFTIEQLGPVSLTTTDVWYSGGASKNAYANYIAGTINTQNVNVTFSLANATFSVQSSDYITIGGSTVTGADLTNLNITANGTYTIPSALLTNTVQTQASNPVSVSLTTTRGTFTSNGTTITNNQPVPFNVTALTGSFASSTVPYWSLNQTFNWTATTSAGATVASGNVTYANVANSVSGSLTSSGATSGTSTSLDSTMAYTISSSDYTGEGRYGAGTRTIPSTVNGTVSAATKYYPLFWKITNSSSVPTFTTSDSHNSNNFVTGQGANTSSTSTDYLWMATPNSTSHTFKHVFLGSDIVDTPDVTSTTTISGQTYKIWGFTNFSAVATILTTS